MTSVEVYTAPGASVATALAAMDEATPAGEILGNRPVLIRSVHHIVDGEWVPTDVWWTTSYRPAPPPRIVVRSETEHDVVLDAPDDSPPVIFSYDTLADAEACVARMVDARTRTHLKHRAQIEADCGLAPHTPVGEAPPDSPTGQTTTAEVTA